MRDPSAASVGQPLQVVCGAPNVAAGQKIAFAAPGVRLPDGTYVYKMTEKGVMLSVALTGTRYWQSEELNAGLD